MSPTAFKDFKFALVVGVIAWLLAGGMTWALGLALTPSNEAEFGLVVGLAVLLFLWTSGRILFWIVCAVFIELLFQKMGISK